MSPKRLMIINGVLVVVMVIVTTTLEVQWDYWWIRLGGALLRGIPLGLCLLGFVLWREELQRNAHGTTKDDDA